MVPIRHVGRSASRSQVLKSDYFKEGDLVLVKALGYPAWPAKISNPEDFKRTTDSYRYFVQLFGTKEVAFVAPSDIHQYTGEIKIRPRGNSNVFRNFEKALREINEAYDRKRKSQVKNAQTISRLEKGKEAAPESQSAVSKIEDSTPSIRSLIELAKEKSKGPCFKRLKQDDSQTAIIASVQPTTDSSTNLLLSTDTNVVRDAFKDIITELSNKRKIMHHATSVALKCARNGIASEVIELIMENLKKEQSMQRKLNLFFLVDSIMQRSRRHRDTRACFVSIIQNELPHMLRAAAPLDVGPQDIHWHCAKILRLWIERKILPKSYLQPYVDGIDTFIKYPPLSDKSLNSQAREIDGVLIEEYGSNNWLFLPGHSVTQPLIEDGNTNIACNPDLHLEIEVVSLYQKDKKEGFGKGTRLDSTERNSPPSPPDSPPLTPPLPLSPMPPLPPNPPSPPPPPPNSPPPTSPMPQLQPNPLPHDPIRSSHLRRSQPPILGPWGHPMMHHGQPPTFYYSWRPT